MVSMKEMSRKSINDLPDSAFAYIESGGSKDSEGKTVPRSLRHFPIHDAEHVRNALARMSQSPHGDKAKSKILAAAKKFGIKVSATEPNLNEVEPHFGYIVDLSSYEFDEAEDGSLSRWIQAFPIGTWHHPVYGQLEMTLDKAVRMAANVNAGVRGQDLDIDYDHKADRKDAAGWVSRAEARTDGLWLLIDWTKEAFEKIKNKAYRYFSPEFANKWEEPRSRKVFKDVLFGGGLTNRPHLKGIAPINLSEFEQTVTVENGFRTSLETIATLYSIKFDEKTSDDNIIKALSEAISKPKETTAPVVETPKVTTDSEPVYGSVLSELSGITNWNI